MKRFFTFLVMLAVCSPELFTEDAACMETCAQYPEVGIYSIRENRGDSVECRIFHATLSTLEPGPHCGTAGPESIPCSDL